jgi:pimeloyl-ACP methyl ester carboxylesterase
MARGVYSGWTRAGNRRVWVRVPAEQKRRANGDWQGRVPEENELYWRRNGDHGPAPAVLVHGIGLTSRSLQPLLVALGEHRPAFAPDLPGFGHSEAPTGVPDIPELAEWLRRWLIHNHVTPAVLVATSFGSQVAVELAARNPALVERLVLIGPTLGPETGGAGRLALSWARGAARPSPGRTAVVARDLIGTGPLKLARALERMTEDPVEEKLPRVEAPALVVHGGRDRLAKRDWAERTAELLPRARLETVPNLPHTISPRAATRLAAVIEDFLGSEPPPAEPAPVPPALRLIVDAMNVIGSKPDGWWRDRPAAWRRLCDALEVHAVHHGELDVTAVIDGRRPGGWRPDELVETSFAGTGEGAADDAIVARVAADPRPDLVTVVSSDAELGRRVRELGAKVRPSAAFGRELTREP